MPLTSRWANVPIPKTDLWTYCMEGPRDSPDDHRVIIDGEKPENGYTSAQLRTLSSSLGRGLLHRFSWNKGDNLALYTPNSIDIPVLLLAGLWAGITITPVSPDYKVDELAQQLRDSQVKGLVTQPSHLHQACEAAKKAGLKPQNIYLLGYNRKPGFLHWRDLMMQGDAPRPQINPDEDVALLMYSSGTTGLPKGVMLTHTNLVASAVQVNKIESGMLHWDTDSQLIFLPMFHLYGIAIIFTFTLHGGIPCIILAHYDIAQVCHSIQKFQISLLAVAPPVVLALSRHPVVDKHDLSSLRWITCGAAPLSRSLVAQVWKRISVPVRQGYGLSETSPWATMQLPDEWWRFHGSVGGLLPNMEAKIVDAQGKELPHGEAGELLLKGSNVFKGYWNRPDLQDEIFTQDGWFRTGDVLYACPKGYLYVTGRIKDLIKYKGFQVPPAELEAKLITHPDVADVSVIGVWDEQQHTEVPRAYVVLKDGVEPCEKRAHDIIAWLADRVAPAKRLRGGLRFIDAIPKSKAGKVLKRVLKSQADEERNTRGQSKL
ncbi:hypothetical protein CDD82_1046 [Ophiocordyceps australis]|uniref:AMP-dependent synthetase/ligase domain-containing protein n=1 Tax=Ophiocordyceps australis TaxID=1399860 RepID=A0A2C5ZNA6_9HYPO|nr:hypothetical protein CDD82_1046 [Ophiocordyceps australis]